MLINAGMSKEDAANAARGLTAIIVARFSGILISIPKIDKISSIIRNIYIVRLYKSGKGVKKIAKQFTLSEQETAAIIETHPPLTVPGTKELPILRKQLFKIAEAFCNYTAITQTDDIPEYVEIKTALESATNEIGRAEQILNRLERSSK